MIQLTLQERISERIVVSFVVVSVPQFQEQIVVSCWCSQEQIQQRWRQIVDFPKTWRLSRTTGGRRNRGRDSLRIGGLLLVPKSTLSMLKKFFVLRARVRDDAGRSPQIELQLGRSFDGPFSGQSVYEQTSGDDKVQD